MPLKMNLEDEFHSMSVAIIVQDEQTDKTPRGAIWTDSQ